MTVNTEDRRPWLPNPKVHENLRTVWQSAQAWLVGYYLLMPDHVHFFCAPRDLNFTIEQWATYWKREFRRLNKDENCRWQSDPFHYRLRRAESYTEKWNYARENPVRKNLVKTSDEWPYQGMVNDLPW